MTLRLTPNLLIAAVLPSTLCIACSIDPPGSASATLATSDVTAATSDGDATTTEPDASSTGAAHDTSGATGADDETSTGLDTASAGSEASDGLSGGAMLPDPLFASGFEASTELGCTDDALRDAGLWDAYGGPSACDGPTHDADIVTDVVHSGARALQVTQKPGNINGTDFRLVKLFGDQGDVTLVGHVRWADDWVWSTADHKLFIFTDGGEIQHNVYVNTRGQAGDPQHARLVLSSIPAGDSASSDDDPAHLLTVGVWYRIRVHLVAGDHGAMEAWITPEGEAEMKLDLVHEAGPESNIDDLPIGSIGGFKIDTTYNDGANIDEPMHQWYDEIAIYEGSIGE